MILQSCIYLLPVYHRALSYKEKEVHENCRLEYFGLFGFLEHKTLEDK